MGATFDPADPEKIRHVVPRSQHEGLTVCRQPQRAACGCKRFSRRSVWRRATIVGLTAGALQVSLHQGDVLLKEGLSFQLLAKCLFVAGHWHRRGAGFSGLGLRRTRTIQTKHTGKSNDPIDTSGNVMKRKFSLEDIVLPAIGITLLLGVWQLISLTQKTDLPLARFDVGSQQALDYQAVRETRRTGSRFVETGVVLADLGGKGVSARFC